jgi:hypothetical protein
VHSGAYGLRNIDALFFMLALAWCSFNKKGVGTRYNELVLLHPMESASNVVHCDASVP